MAGVEAGRLRDIMALKSIEVELHHPWYWHMWRDLHTERQIGMAVGPIPASAIDRVAVNEGLTVYGAWVFHYVIRALDDHYLARLQREREENLQNSK